MKVIDSVITPPRCTPDFTEHQSEMLFFDIETTGLSPNASSLYLIGAMFFQPEENQWLLRQWFADDYRSEKNMLQAFLDFLSGYQYLIHFNGATFDIPYIVKKCKRYKLSIPEKCNAFFQDQEGIISIDLLKHIRKLKRLLSLEKCNQTQIERWLDIIRTDIFSGGDLIPVYSEYMQQKILSPPNAEKLEKTLLLHNHDDIEMMLAVSSLLQYENILCTEFHKKYPMYLASLFGCYTLENLKCLELQHTEGSLTLSMPLPCALPKAIGISMALPTNDILSQNNVELDLKTDSLHITLPLFSGTLKAFLPNPGDYYYLPEEDVAMHKSVAEFVDKAYRKKATASTCYIKKEGVFLPLLLPRKKRAISSSEEIGVQEFRNDYSDKLSFVELPKEPQSAYAFWQSYLESQLCAFL